MTTTVASALRLLAPAIALLTAAAALAAAPAQAQTETETSANVKFVKNLPYTLRWESTTPEGTDMEFATLTLPGTVAPPALPATPATPAKPKRRTSKRAAYNRCVRRARKVKNRRKRAAAQRKCKRLLRKKSTRRTKGRMTRMDVNPTEPGIQKTFAFAGSYVNGLHIIDVSDPANPVLAADYDCGISQGDVQVFHRPDLGKTFAAYASDDSYAFQADSQCFVEADRMGYKASDADGDGTFIVDVSDPYNPKTVSFVEFDKGSHNQTVHPSGRYLYNSNSNLATDVEPGIEIADITNPSSPKAVTTLAMPIRPGLGSNAHDVTFSADGNRAYVAGVSHTSVLDTSDPTSPKILSSIFDPAVNVSHQAEAITANVPGIGERTLLLVADEFAGATDTGQCPNGGVHVYDVSPELEALPVKLGYWNIADLRPTDMAPSGTCTAHVWQLHAEQKLMIIGWYNAGFRVVDIAELGGVAFGAEGTGMKEIGFGRAVGGSVWSAKAPVASRDVPFTVYSNDQLRGFDAWTFDPKTPERRRGSVGTWYPAGSEPKARARTGTAMPAFRCLLERD